MPVEVRMAHIDTKGLEPSLVNPMLEEQPEPLASSSPRSRRFDSLATEILEVDLVEVAVLLPNSPEIRGQRFYAINRHG
jgi:hypothetical protein